MTNRYDVVVVGSGYGGAIAASRFARAGRSVCLLERGKERWPGEYPETLLGAALNTQINTLKRRFGSRTALYDIRFDDEVNVLVGCGLGGTSLINANVALRPIEEVFDDQRWPAAIRGDSKHTLRPYFERAEQWLGSTPYPQGAPRLAKLDALHVVAEHLDAPVARAPVNVNFEGGVNAAGIEQAPCNGCGNCVTGCNVGAKNTVLMNYLPDAAAHGAAIFTERSVEHVEKLASGGWRVAYRDLSGGRASFKAPPQHVEADIVVLAAGTLGSTEIMLRSRDAGLACSPRLGERFNGNGDVLGFGYDSAHNVNAIGWRAGHAGQPVGPTISGFVSASEPVDGVAAGLGTDDLVIEEGAIPGALSRVLPFGLLYTALASSNAPLRTKVRMVFGSWRRAAQRTLTYLVMSNDDSNGRIVLSDNGVTVEWPSGPTDAHIQRNNRVLEQVSPAIGAQYSPEMWWNEAMGHQLITVHPLGGCVMADDASHGVVNDRCEVFAGADGDEVHRGLHVMDGAVLSRPVNTNPSLTISALVERAVELTIADRGWDLDWSPAASRLQPAFNVQAPDPGVEFTERMAGWVDHRDHATSPLSFIVTITVDDLAAMQSEPSGVQRVGGTVEAPSLSATALTIEHGEFQLLRRVPERAEEWNMRYRMRLSSVEGQAFWFDGHKVVRTGSMWRGWKDTTTLFVSMGEIDADGTEGPTTATGVLRIGVIDLLRQLWTIDTPGAGFALRQRRKLRFAQAFAGAFLPKYGGLFAEGYRPDNQPFDNVRTPRLPHPSASVFSAADGWTTTDADTTARIAMTGPDLLRSTGSPIIDGLPDDAELLLTRFNGGSKGPVLLAAGFSMRANSFAEPTTDTTLTEALVEAGFDVWLFDYRASIALPSSRTEFTIDDIATLDWPRAVDQVRRLTGAESVQVVGHCVGSVSILMALLAGLDGVRSAVCSQFAVHPVTGPLNKFKNSVRAIELFQAVGIGSLEPSTGRRFKDRVTDLAGALLPIPRGERCQQPMCRWLNAIFGLTHTHEQLNAATHASFTAAFGVGEVKPLRHLSSMLGRGRAVNAAGEDTYLPHVDRLDLPVLFIQGSKNYIFKPKGMQRTLDWLRTHHDPALHELLRLEGYAHLDGIVGTHAARDVYPHIIEHLERNGDALTGA